MKHISFLIVLALFTCASFAQERNFKLVKQPTENPTSQTRKAIVIGMSDYGEGRSLSNTVNDADDMAAVLTQLGFEVTLLKNNDLRNLRSNLDNWYAGIEGNDMAVFYFAGHGIEVNGRNYLVPVGAEMNSQTDVEYNTLNVNQILGNMDEKRVGMKLIILDACRDNPFKRSWTRGIEDKGLAGMNAPRGTFIAFAASPGFTAQDGANYNLKNGVFTYFLKQEILKTGLSIDDIFNNVTGDVSGLTNEQQTPFKNSSLTRTFYFIPPGESPLALLERANTLFANKQYKESIPLYEQVANAGNAEAQNKLGNSYYNGWGVAQDYTQAAKWYKKAAEQGSDAAQNNLGFCYENGYGVTKDINQAVEWYKKAADQGNINAQQVLFQFRKTDLETLVRQADSCYNNKQYNDAFPLYMQITEKEANNTDAQNKLGKCYYNGYGASQDYKQAAYWFYKAADQGQLNAQTNLGICYQNGNGVTQDYKQAVYWYRKAANQGDVNAQTNLGVCYYNSWGVKQDYTQAVEWYKKAAEQGKSVAQYNLGTCYEDGNGVKKDNVQAAFWYRKAADQGDADAKKGLERLGESYQ